MKDYILKESNDLFTYYEIINQMEAKYILDVGMFLKRVGSLTRNTVGEQLPENAFLFGVDFTPEKNFPTWENIYDRIRNIPDFMEESLNQIYEVGIFLGVQEALPESILEKLINKMKNCVEYVLIDDTLQCWDAMKVYKRKIPFMVDEKIYYVLELKGV